MARRADHTSAQLEKLIIDAAQAIMEGGEEVSTRAIARRIGYVQGTLYAHFKDLDAIILQVNARTMDGLIARMADVAATAVLDPDETIHTYADVYVDYVTANRRAWDAMFRRQRKPDAPAPEWYRAQIDQLVGQVARAFARIDDSRSAPRCRLAAQLVWASVHSICALESGGRLSLIMQLDLPKAVHRIVDVHIAAFKAGKP